MSVRRVALTTNDNPFDPLLDFQNWFKFDTSHNYATCQLIARRCPSPETESVPDELIEGMKEEFIDRWVNMFPELYSKVVHEMDD